MEWVASHQGLWGVFWMLQPGHSCALGTWEWGLCLQWERAGLSGWWAGRAGLRTIPRFLTNLEEGTPARSWPLVLLLFCLGLVICSSLWQGYRKKKWASSKMTTNRSETDPSTSGTPATVKLEQEHLHDTRTSPTFPLCSLMRPSVWWNAAKTNRTSQSLNILILKNLVFTNTLLWKSKKLNFEKVILGNWIILGLRVHVLPA